MSNEYVENDKGFFVKTTLFKDDVNGRKWRTPFSEVFYKGISRSFGKIPYIDLRNKTLDEHQEYENDKYVTDLQRKGLTDEQIMDELHRVYSQPEIGKVGVVVDMYDVQKKATYGNVLNTCALSMGMCEKSDPDVAVIDFIIKIEDENYKKGIKDGTIQITPSPSLYGNYIKQADEVEILNTGDFFDMIHVANATIPANGQHAKMKAFCEGDLGTCKKKMMNAALPVIENINNTVTNDTIRMSEQTPNPATTTQTVAVADNAVPSTSGFNAEEFKTVLNNYNVPKEVVEKLELVNKQLETLATANEATKKELEAFRAAEEQRKLNERKSLITKHIDVNKVFKGDTEAFTKKIEWINKMQFNDEDLSTYLNEAFPIKEEAKEPAKGDKPETKAVYGSLQFNPDELLKQETGAEAKPTTKKTGNTWGSLIPLSISQS